MKARGKKFLSESVDEGGSVSWSIRTGDNTGIFNYYVEGRVDITDCSKCISLDFDCGEVKHIPKRIVKLRTLIDELIKVEDALKLAHEEAKPKKFYY